MWENIRLRGGRDCMASIGYSTIKTKEADRIGYNGFLFTNEKNETRYI